MPSARDCRSSRHHRANRFHAARVRRDGRAPKTLEELPVADHNDYELLAGDEVIQSILDLRSALVMTQGFPVVGTHRTGAS